MAEIISSNIIIFSPPTNVYFKPEFLDAAALERALDENKNSIDKVAQILIESPPKKAALYLFLFTSPKNSMGIFKKLFSLNREKACRIYLEEPLKSKYYLICIWLPLALETKDRAFLLSKIERENVEVAEIIKNPEKVAAILNLCDPQKCASLGAAVLRGMPEETAVKVFRALATKNRFKARDILLKIGFSSTADISRIIALIQGCGREEKEFLINEIKLINQGMIQDLEKITNNQQ